MTKDMLSGKTKITVTSPSTGSTTLRKCGYCADAIPKFTFTGANVPQNCTEITLGTATNIPSYTSYIYVVCVTKTAANGNGRKYADETYTITLS